MSFESSEFDELMPHTVTFEATSVTNKWGAKTPAAAKTIKARIEQFAKKVIADDGREIVSGTRLFLKPTATDGSAYTPTVSDKFTLPAGFTPQTPVPIKVERQDDTGLHHFVVSFQ